MGLSASGGQRHRTEAQPYRILRLVQSAAPASGAQVANTGRGLFRPARASRRTGRVTRWHRNAVNLWTVGCADPRLTAQARSPVDKPGKTLCVSPTLPTGRRLPTSFTAPQQPQAVPHNLTGIVITTTFNQTFDEGLKMYS